MKKFKVEWINKRTYNCSHIVEACDEMEAEKKCRSLDSHEVDSLDENENEDYDFEVNRIEEK
jgi:hypothetical protein